jgi:acetyltransferase-like isoleucine patch superfamily enzyme
MIAHVTSITVEPDRISLEQPRRSKVQLRLKRSVQALATICTSFRLLRYYISSILMGRRAFSAASESIANIPGVRGVFLRQAFYRRTLARCGRDVYFGWQSVFSMPEAAVGESAYIGRFCSIGFADIGDEVMLADGVQILSGGHEHSTRGDEHHSMREQSQSYQKVCIGRGAWIGARAVVMSHVGEHAIIGAGAVVTRPIPAGCVAVGVPARVIKYRSESPREFNP